MWSFYEEPRALSHRPTLRAINPTFSTTSTYLHDGKEGETSVRSGVAAPQEGEEEDRQGARHDRVPQVSRVVVFQLGQGGLSGEAETRGRGRRVDGADPAHRARGVAARPLVLSRQRGAARNVSMTAGPRRAAVGPQSLPRQRLFDA